MLFNGNSNLLTGGKSDNFCCKCVSIEVKPLGNRAGSVCFDNCLELFALLALIFKRDFIACFEEIRRNVDVLAVYLEVVVGNKLSCFCAGACPTEKINYVVKAAFADTEKVFTGDALLALSLDKILMELAFLNTVVASALLLRAKLQTVFG